MNDELGTPALSRSLRHAATRKQAKAEHLKLPRPRHCACGRPAIEHRRGGWVCALCLKIEARQERDKRRRERNLAWRKILDAASHS